MSNQIEIQIARKRITRSSRFRRTWRSSRPIALLFLLAFAAVASSTHAADELLPPFGFRWNDSTSRVEAVLNGAKAKIVSRDKKENRDVWTVEGLVHPGLQRTLFSFKNGSLFGVGKILLKDYATGIVFLAVALAAGAVIYRDLSRRGWSSVLE